MTPTEVLILDPNRVLHRDNLTTKVLGHQDPGLQGAENILPKDIITRDQDQGGITIKGNSTPETKCWQGSSFSSSVSMLTQPVAWAATCRILATLVFLA